MITEVSHGNPNKSFKCLLGFTNYDQVIGEKYPRNIDSSQGNPKVGRVELFAKTTDEQTEQKW